MTFCSCSIFIPYKSLILSLGLLLFLAPSVLGQTTIWSEDFSTNSNNDITGDDNNLPVGADWTTSCSSCNLTGEFRVEGGEFQVENTDEIATWTSETIDISGYSNVSLSVQLDMNDNQLNNTDCMTMSYNLDGGGNTQFATNGNLCGDGLDPVFATQTGLSGSTLVIVIEGITTNNNEDIFFDNIIVTGTPSLGPDGIGGVGDTDGSGSMSLWLDANQGVTTTGTAVTEWADQSGYGNDATPPAASNRPALDATGTNSHPVITFDGSTDYLTASDASSLDLTNWSIIIVGIVNTEKNYNAFVVKGDDADENYEFLTNFPSAGNIHYPVRYTTSDRTADSDADDTFSTTEYGVYQLDYDQTNFQVYINGDLTETDAETRAPQTNSNELYIGNEESTSGREVAASIAEIAIFSTPVNDAQRNIIHNAMAAKYGFDMDANSLYDEDESGNGDFDFDVAGIGQASDGSSHEDAQGTGIVRVNTPSGLGNGEYLIWGHNNDALSSFGISDLPSGVESRLDREWRVSETGEVGTVSISFDLSGVFGSKSASDLRLLIDTDDDGLFSDETGSGVLSGATNTSGDIFEWSGVDLENNQRFTIGSVNFTNTPLPIELLSFDAQRRFGDEVLVSWSTASEINNDFFSVERADNDGQWSEIKRVDGAGNSNRVLDYQWIDREPLQEEAFYRLKQVDWDGAFTYSSVRRLEANPLILSELKVFPNPTEQLLTIQGDELATTAPRFFSATGFDVSSNVSLVSKAANSSTFDVSRLASGVYLIQLNRTSVAFFKL